MAGFTEAAFEKKLADLNNSQQSIQTLSLWLIHHRKHYRKIVSIWHKEFLKTKDSRKLTYVYLVNDVIQNSKKKGPEFGKEFGLVLTSVFHHMGALPTKDDKIHKGLERLMQIWVERNIYDANQVADFRKAFESGKGSREENDEPPAKVMKRESAEINGSDSDSAVKETAREHRKSESSETVSFNSEGKKEVHVTLSPKPPARDPPEPEELIKALQDLENAASSDAVVREKIAKYPPAISDVAALSNLTSKEEAESLAQTVEEAVLVVNDYNGRLMKEMEERKNLARMLQDFLCAQRELLAQAEQRLEEYREKLTKVYQVREELKSHVKNLPDLSQLPDVSSGGLPPLPSAGDLFRL